MTTPQSGREAFEALVDQIERVAEYAGRYDPGVAVIDMPSLRKILSGVAALAQQGREVGEAVAWLCKAEARVPPAFVESEAVARDTYERVGYNITPLYTAAPKQQAADEEPIYYMRDNHTFKRLSNSVSAALVEIEAEFNAGYTHGMLCSKRSGFKDIHASGSTSRMVFLAECRAALAALPGKTEVDRG